MSNKLGNPPTVAEPFGNYSHYCEVDGNSRIVYIAGQVGVQLDGTLSEDTEDQCRAAFTNVVAVLTAVGMTPADVTKLTVFILDRTSLSAYKTARNSIFGDFRPPTTVAVVSGLADPEWKIEIDVCAAKAR
jgi:2-iminobutanoate/2-iminopropanoate deaminase